MTDSPGHDIVCEMRIDRRGDIMPARFDRRQKADQRRSVVAFGEALAVHDPLPRQLGVCVQEAVGRDELNLRRVRPTSQEGLQNTRRRRLADRNRSGDADDVGHLAVDGAEEPLGRFEQPLGRGDVEREQTRQRQIDRHHLVERNRVVSRLQLAKIVDRQGELGVCAQLRPFVAGKAPERGLERRAADFTIHGDFLALAPALSLALARGLLLVAALPGAASQFAHDRLKRDAARLQHDE